MRPLFLGRWAACAAALLFAGCGPKAAYISADPGIRVELGGTEYHAFDYVKAENQPDAFVLYGKTHRMNCCCDDVEGHVHVEIFRPDGILASEADLPIIDRGTARKGWRGASFRGRLPIQVREGSRIRLSISDPHCRPLHGHHHIHTKGSGCGQAPCPSHAD